MKKFCVISHTHWDREWYQPFEQFRMRLVSLIDNLLEIIEKYPDYIFHLDAQTIVIDDYLEIKPQNKDLLKKHIKDGNILIGPWYVQNDFYLTSGEATVRNLQYGIKMADELGACERVGYTPDQFGLIGQLPQIFRQFDIDNCIFGRGYTSSLYWDLPADEFAKIAPPSEFIWGGADGSKILGIHMSYWYNNCQRLSQNSSWALKLVESIEKSFDGIATTPYFLLMNGVDHLEAQENLLPILSQLNKDLPEGDKIVQTTMQNYIDLIKQHYDIESINNELDIPSLTVHSNEMRNGGNGNVLQNTFSSHIYLKPLNVKAQNTLECFIEPLYTMIDMKGANIYPKEYLDYLWKLLMKNHPHDSICGCSHDHVHEQMEDRYQRFFDMTDILGEQGMKFISEHTDLKYSDEDYIITVCNFSEKARSGVVSLDIELVKHEAIRGFKIVDHDDREMDFYITKKTDGIKNYFSAINLPGATDVDVYETQIHLENIAPMSINNYILKAVDSGVTAVSQELPDVNMAVLENDYLRAEISNDGTVNVFDKVSNTLYEDAFSLIDREDVGDAYVTKYVGCPEISSKNAQIKLTNVLNTPISNTCRLTYTMMVPAEFDSKNNTRSKNLVPLIVTVDFRLCKGDRWLGVDFEFDNNIKDHRLRAVITTGIKTNLSYSLAPFDVVERDIRNIFDGLHNGDQPNSGFVSLGNEKRSFAVLTNGVYEYQHTDADNGKLEFTLVRSVRGFGTFAFKAQQVKRYIKLSMAIMPHNYSSHEQVHADSKQFQCGMPSSCFPADVKKFSGGRVTVQSTEIQEVFYRDDIFSNVKVSYEYKLNQLLDSGIGISALKKTMDGKNIVIRLVNYGCDSTSFDVSDVFDNYKVYLSNMEEKQLNPTPRNISINAKEVKTIILTSK